MTEEIDAPTPQLWLAKREAEDIKQAIAARLANPNARPGAYSRHVQVTDCLKGGKVSTCCSCWHCTLSVCSRCGAYEGGLTSHCPGERVDVDTSRAVYATSLDYLTDRGWHLSDAGMRRRCPIFRLDQPGVA
jgi:hypothetical protein